MSAHNNYSIIFDMDGVLVDSEPVIEAAAIRGLAEYGIEAVSEDFKPFIGAGEDRYIGGVAEKYGVPYQLEMKSRVYEIYLTLVKENLHVYAGTLDLLSKLEEEDVSIALASSADVIKVKANLKVAEIPFETFKTVITGEDVVHKKPSPEIFLKAAEGLKVHSSRCIVVEDAVNGIRAAKAAGMKCIAIASTFSKELLQAEKPDCVVDSIKEVYWALKSIGI